MTPDRGPPQADDEDRTRWARVGGLLANDEVVTVDRLHLLSASVGNDEATAALYWRLRQSACHGPLVRAVERGDCPGIDVAPYVLIVPGAFHRHHAGTGADGRKVLAAAVTLGWKAEVLPVGSLSPMDANAAALVDRLHELGERPVLIVSLSKGSADVAIALRRAEATTAFANVVGWLGLSGLVLGTPLVDWLRRQWWRMPGVRLLLWWMGLRLAEVAELSHGAGGRLHEPPTLPPHVRAIHVIGFPCRKHLRHPWAGRGYERLLPLGPNDGGGILLGDVERLTGTVYPVWGVDHYLSPAWDFTPSLTSLLCHAAVSQTAPTATPAIKSST